MRTIIATAMILTVSVANAVDGQDTRGAGAMTCGQFAEAYRKGTDAELVFFSWAEGMMTGINLSISASTHRYFDLGARSTDDQMAFIRSYCNSHPLAPYARAVSELLSTLPLKDVPK
jgi:hypothetical protein